MIVVALALFVTQRTGSAGDVGLVLTAYVVPMIVFLPLGGVWADRIPRRRLMIVSDVVRCASQGVLALLITFGAVPLGLVMALEALCAAAQAFFRPAYTGLLPQTVPDELVQSATSISSLSDTGASFVGPALSTALIAVIGAAAVFFVDSASFAVSAILLLRVNPRPRGERSPRTGVLRELHDGYRAVRTRTWVWVTLVTVSIAVCVGFAPYLVLGPTIAEQHYHHSNFFGLLATAMGAGSVAGALLGLRWRPRQPLKAGLIAIVIWPPTFALFALGAPLGIVLAAMLLSGAAITLFEVWWDTTLIERIPPEVLSRVSAWDWLGSVGLMPVGYLVAGALASGVGADAVLAVGAAIAAVLLLASLTPRETRALTGGPQVPPGAAEASA